jgi:hypothetical protein
VQRVQQVEEDEEVVVVEVEGLYLQQEEGQQRVQEQGQEQHLQGFSSKQGHLQD